MQLVKDGKLSPEDAAELMEAFQDAPDEDEDEVVDEAAEPADPADPEDPADDAEESSASDGAKAGDGASKSDDPFAKLISSIEKLGKDVAENVDWKQVSAQLREGVSKGVDAVKQAAEQAAKGKGPFGSVFGAQERKRVELPLAVAEGKVFRIEAQNGDIEVVGGHDLGQIIIDAAFKAYNDEEAKKMADVYMPVLEESDDEVILRQPDPSGVTADIKVLIGTGVAVKIKNSNGDVSVSGTKGSVQIQNSSGDIKVAGAANLVTVSTSKGVTKVVDSKVKNLDVESKSGDIVLERVQGSMALKTSSGDIVAYECSARTVAAEAASGDVTLDMVSPVDSAYNVRTVSGDVRIELPDGNDARVHLSTLRGEVTCGFDLEDENVDRMKVTGRLGEGAGVIDVSAVNGDVSLGLRDSGLKDRSGKSKSDFIFDVTMGVDDSEK